MDKVYTYSQIISDSQLNKMISDGLTMLVPDINFNSIIATCCGVNTGFSKDRLGSVVLILTNEYLYVVAKLTGEKERGPHRFDLLDIERFTPANVLGTSNVTLMYNDFRINIPITSYKSAVKFQKLIEQAIIDLKKANESKEYYENMSIEELQKLKEETEKKRLIEEIQNINSQPSLVASTQTIDSDSSAFKKFLDKREELGPLTKSARIRENKKKGIACCPKCGSTSLSTTNKKLSVTRGAVGGALLGPLGAVAGGLTSKKVFCVCMTCGHKWKL